MCCGQGSRYLCGTAANLVAQPANRTAAASIRSAALAEDATFVREHGGYRYATDALVAMRLGVSRGREARHADPAVTLRGYSQLTASMIWASEKFSPRPLGLRMANPLASPEAGLIVTAFPLVSRPRGPLADPGELAKTRIEEALPHADERDERAPRAEN